MRDSILTIIPAQVSDALRIEALLGACPELRSETVGWDAVAFDWLDRHPARLLVVAPGESWSPALRLFRRIAEHPVAQQVLAFLDERTPVELADTAVEVADDFLMAPADPHEFRRRVMRLVRRASKREAQVRERLTREFSLANLRGNDPAFRGQVDRLPACAESELPVLITGETGTGKELFARGIHHVSARRDANFIPLDCGAIPEHLIENELFGHARGAFTDAHRDQKGLIAMASGGTLFLDEVDALSLGAQAKLLRFLQERTYRPLGSERFLRADVKVVAATNRDIEDCVAQGRFRSDLYYRLNVLRLRLPSLRERRGDIGVLAMHFLRETPGGEARWFAAAVLDALRAQDWPGNVRELQNVVQRAAVFAPGAEIAAADVASPRPVAAAAASFQDAKQRSIQEFEREYVLDLMNKHGGNITHAAREAGKDRRAFGRLVAKYRAQRCGGPAA